MPSLLLQQNGGCRLFYRPANPSIFRPSRVACNEIASYQFAICYGSDQGEEHRASGYSSKNTFAVFLFLCHQTLKPTLLSVIILAPVFSPLVYFWCVVRHEIFRDETGDSACHLIVAGRGRALPQRR